MYEDMKSARVSRESTESAAKTDKKEKTAGSDKSAENELECVRVGREYIKQINAANEAIPGEEISRKLSELSLVMDRIFAYVQAHPETEGSLRKFMDYYLPTTLKLVTAYKEFDAQPVQGENIRKSKMEIEESLDTINNAFTRLYDDMYADTAMDISTDINVLNTLFAQDGLKK